MPGKVSTLPRPQGKAPLRDRFVAWWHGLNLSPDGKKASAARGSKAVEKAPGPVDLSTRANVVQAMWGDGCVAPGDADFFTYLAKPLRFSKELSALDLGAGLGGPDRDLAKAFGIWIDGLEADRDLVTEGAQLAKDLGMEKKATLSPFDPAIVELPERKYDRVFSKELWSTIAGRERLFKEVVKTLRAKGEFLLVDFVVGDEEGARSRLDAALGADGRIRDPWTANAYVDALKVSGLEVRVAEDITDMYLEVILARLRPVHSNLRGDPHLVPNDLLVRELSIWLQRIDLMRKNCLRLYRFHALKANAPKPMSDW